MPAIPHDITIDLFRGGDRAAAARERIRLTLEAENGSVRAAAKRLGVSEPTFYRWLATMDAGETRQAAGEMRAEAGISGQRTKMEPPKRKRAKKKA